MRLTVQRITLGWISSTVLLMSRARGTSGTDYGAPIYQEKLIWPIWLWAFCIFLTGSLSLAVWAATDPTLTIAISIVQLLALVVLERSSALVITVTKGWLIVGKASIPRAHIHNFRVLDPQSMKRIRGADGDPAAFISIRFWVTTGISMNQRDPKDPTPYWLISSKRPEELKKALFVESASEH